MDIYKRNFPEVWGPHYWYMIHTYAANYPNNPTEVDKKVAFDFIKILPFLLPCYACSNHAFGYIKKNYKTLKTYIQNRSMLEKFFYDFHNHVNLSLGKPIYSKL